MDNPRPEKVAVVTEVRERLAEADATVLTEYRGLNVPALAALRGAVAESGGEVKIYKNTLVRFAARDLGLDIDDLLTGPTALAFVGTKSDGSPGDAVGMAKALKKFAGENDKLVIKGGLLGTRRLSEADVKALAEVAPREELLARLAGGLAAPMRYFASALQALPRNFAYALAALIDKQGGAPEAPAAAGEPAAADEAPETEAVAADEATPAEATESTESTDPVADEAATTETTQEG